MKYGIIPDTKIRFKLGDIVEVPDYEGNTIFGTVTKIEDTLLTFRGYYNIYINHESTYYRSSDVISWYRKNRKGILVKYCDDNLIAKLYEEAHRNDPLDPRFEEIKNEN